MKGICTALALLWLMCLPVRGVLEEERLAPFWRQAEEYGISQDTEPEQELGVMLEKVPGILEDRIDAGLRTAVKVLAVVLVCALGQGMETAGSGKGLSTVRLAGAISITALAMTDMSAMIGLGRDTIGRMDVFSTVLLPVMAALTALSGGITAAAVRQGTTVVFSKGLVAVMDGLLIPLVYAYAAVSCARAAAGTAGLERMARGIKSVVTGVLTVLLILFVGYLTASGAIAGSVDASRVKAARMAISRAIPVVGSILADASETVLAGAGALRSSVGAAGLLVVLAICLVPFLHLAVQYVIYKATAALCAVVAQPELAALVDAIGSAFGLVLGMTGASALILLVSIVSAVQAVTV